MSKVEFELKNIELQDVKKFCELNGIELSELIVKCFRTGYNIEKYGLLNHNQTEIIVEKEVIKEVIKEVPVEKVVSKIEYIRDNKQIEELQKKIDVLEEEKAIFITTNEKKEQSSQNETIQQLQNTIQILTGKIREKDKEIKELNEIIENIPKVEEIKPAVYLRSSNLEDNLYKD